MSRNAEQFPRRVLVAASGLSPQVITETLYALAVRREPPFVPTEVRLITTWEGAERARLSLLSAEPGWFHRFCREYSVEGVRFGENGIHIVEDSEGRPLSDIRSGADNLVTADRITEWMRQLTSDEQAALHVSLAGGRKTMGFYLAYTLSLLGRPQDRLSHVLVSAPFESHPDFYFPTKERRVIYTAPPDSRPLDTSAAEVTLAEIPFVRLRPWLPANLLEDHVSFGQAVEAAQRNLGPPELRFSFRARQVQAGLIAVALAPAEMAFYAWLARRKCLGAEPLPCPSDGAPEPCYATGFLEEYRRILGELGSDERTAGALRHGMEKSFFLERKARLHRVLRDALGHRAEPYLVRAIGKRPETRYDLGLAAERIYWSD